MMASTHSFSLSLRDLPKSHPDPRRGSEFNQVLPTITTWAEVERVILPVYPTPSNPANAHFVPFVSALRYVFFEQRAGVVVCIRPGGRIALAYQIANEQYENTWHQDMDLSASAERLLFASSSSSTSTSSDRAATTTSTPPPPRKVKDLVLAYEAARGRVGAGDESAHVLTDPARWWLNGRVVCNVPARNVWGDGFVREMMHYISTVCRQHPELEMDAILNRRDCALLPVRAAALRVPFPFHDIVRCFSFYTSRGNYFDRSMPVVEDWLHICGEKLHPCTHADWEARQPRAVFRGSSTGHACAELNVRIRLAKIGKEHPHLLDAAITSVCCRDGIIISDHRAEVGRRKIVISSQSRRDLSHIIAPQMPMQTQFNTYRFVVYAPGHSAASRYGALLGSGCVVIRLNDPSCPCPDVWFEKELTAVKWSPRERRLSKVRLDPEDADHICATVFEDGGGSKRERDGSSSSSFSLVQAITWLQENNALAKMLRDNALKKYAKIMTVGYASEMLTGTGQR